MATLPFVEGQHAMKQGFGQIPDGLPLFVLGGVAMSQDMARRSPLDDPRISGHAWARYKRLMKWMFVFTLVIVTLALGSFYLQNGMVSIHFFIATALGIGFAMLLMSALMGLVFLSSGTGHDESVSDLTDDQAPERSSEGRNR